MNLLLISQLFSYKLLRRTAKCAFDSSKIYIALGNDMKFLSIPHTLYIEPEVELIKQRNVTGLLGQFTAI